MNKFFECGVRYDKTMDDGLRKKVTELYIVDAFTFTEAEARITGEMKPYISEEFDVVTEKITSYSGIVPADDINADKWYKVKLNFITVDERSGREKKTPVYYLIQASDIDDARKRTDRFMDTSMQDYTTEAVSETKVVDVFLHKEDE